MKTLRTKYAGLLNIPDDWDRVFGGRVKAGDKLYAKPADGIIDPSLPPLDEYGFKDADTSTIGHKVEYMRCVIRKVEAMKNDDGIITLSEKETLTVDEVKKMAFGPDKIVKVCIIVSFWDIMNKTIGDWNEYMDARLDVELTNCRYDFVGHTYKGEAILQITGSAKDWLEDMANKE